MEKVALLEPEVIGLPQRAVRGFGRGWREAFGRALHRPKAKPIGEELALARALDEAHLHHRLDERRRNGSGFDFLGNSFDFQGLG